MTSMSKINNINLQIYKRLAYYLGYWLGDGTSMNPGTLTIGKEDQTEAKIILEQLANELNLKLTMGRNKKGLIALIKGVKGRGGNVTASGLKMDWLKNITAACEELEISNYFTIL